jgi:CRISPR/Cas system-associated protein endoribonuclease Cas2
MIIRNKFNGYVGGNNRLYPGGGGGSQPTNTTQTTTTIPEYARPYVERMLGKAEAFSESPYQAYGGERVAGFTPLQEQSFQGAANLGPAKQLGTGTQLAGIAGLGGLGAGQQYAQQATNPYAMQSYMSPYIENAMAPQLREAARASAIQGQQNQAMAAQRGAFGGSRSAIVEAERQRNLAQQQGDIYGRGMQTAFEQARQAQQFGADLGLRGYGMAGQMAGTLGQLGQTQFGQQQGAIQAQAAAGAQQQAMEQQKMSQAYQDFLSQRGYPQQQLSFMSDILRGVPLGQQTQVQYQAPPPMASQLAQLGLGAYGFSQMMKKEGGIIKMAEGGIANAAPQGSVPNTMPIDKLRSVLGDMSEEQLDQVAQGAGDATTLALVQEQKNLNARIRNSGILAESTPQTTIKEEMIAADNTADSGIAAAPMPAAMFADTAVGEAPEEAPAMRGGGIVAFAKGREVKAPPDDVSAFRAMDISKAVMTEEERLGAEEKGLAKLEKFLGPDRSVELAEKVAKASELGPQAESRAKAAAAFEMMAAFGEAVPFATAAGKAGAIAGRNMREYEKLKRESEKEANKLRLDTARYERAEKMQRYGEANKIAQQMEDRKAKIYGLEADKNKTLADIQLKKEQIASSERVGMAGVAATRAGQFNLDREFLSAETQRGIEDYRARNNGKDPVGQELANIRSEAATKVAEMKRYNPYGAPNIDIRLQSEITEAQRYDEGIKNLRAKYLMADDKDKPAIQAEIQARLDEVARTVQSRVQRPGVPTTTTQPPPAAGNQPTPKAEYDKLPKGAIYTDPNGVQRIKG